MASSLGTFLAPRLPYVQSALSDLALQSWLRQATTAVNLIPPTSQFSFASPNSNVTAVRGTWGHNLSSAGSVTWLKQVGSGNTGWIAIA